MARVAPHSDTPRQVKVTLVKPPPPLKVKKGGDEWKLFKQMWSNYCNDTRLDDEEETHKRALFLHTLGKDGLALCSRMQLPSDDFVNNIITAFDNHFFGRTSEPYQRYVFNKRDQKADESVEDYIAVLRSLASTCNFCDCLKDTLLRDRILLGIKDSNIRNRLLQEADLTLETCITMCCAAAATTSQPVKTVTRTEDTTAVQAGSISSGDQRPNKKRKISLSHAAEATSSSLPVKTVTRIDNTAAVQVGSVSSVDQRPKKKRIVSHSRAPEATSSSQPVTWTEDTTAVQAGSVSSGDQRPDKEQDLSWSLRGSEQRASTHEAEIDFNTEMGDSDDDWAPMWTTEHQSSDVPCDRTEDLVHKDDNKLESAWSMEEDSRGYPSVVYSTAQPVSDNTYGSLLSLNTSHMCQHCSAAFVLVSALELHLASVHGEKLHTVLPGSSTPDSCDVSNNTVVHKQKEIHKEVRKMGKAKGSTSKKATKPDSGDAGDCSDSDWKPDGFSDGSESDWESESPRKRRTHKKKKLMTMILLMKLERTFMARNCTWY